MKMNLTFAVDFFCTCGTPLEARVDQKRPVDSIVVSPCHRCYRPKDVTPEREIEIGEKVAYLLGEKETG